MTWQTYIGYMALLSKNYSKNIFNPKDEDMANLWFKMLEHYDDETFISAIKKIMLNEIFAPNLATISKYCSEVAAPLDCSDTEGWGLVVKAINNYGYMRAEEAMQSLPLTVRKAVESMGGFEQICLSEKPDVIRGQFDKVMASINLAERTRRRERTGLEQAILLANSNEDKLQLESKDWSRKSSSETEEGLQHVYEAYRKAVNDNDN